MDYDLNIRWELALFGYKIADAFDMEEEYCKLLSLEARRRKLPLDEISPPARDDSTKGTILLTGMDGYNVPSTYFYAIFAHIFRSRGFEPLVLMCDGCLSRCVCDERDKFDDMKRGMCTQSGRLILESNGISPHYLSEFSDEVPEGVLPDKFEEALEMEYKGIDISRHAKGELRANLRRYQIKDHHRAEYERTLRSAIRLVDAGEKVFDEYDIDIVLGDHPVYLPGVIPAVGYKHGVNTYTFATARREQRLTFNRWDERGPLRHHTDRDHTERIIKRPLTDAERKKIDELMAGRESGSKLNVNHLEVGGETIEVDDWEQSIGLFSNLVWDGAVDVKYSLFSDPFNWVQASIEAVPSDTLLIIKPHPAEDYRGSKERVGDWITEQYTTLPENIKILPPSTDISPYSLVDTVDVVTVWTSTIGVEAAYKKVPVIPAANAHYRGYGFTEDLKSAEEYRTLLKSLNQVTMTEEMHQRARRYAYYMFIQQEIEFPFFKTENGLSKSLQKVNQEEIGPGNDNIDLIVERMASNEPVYKPRQFINNPSQ